VIGDQKEGAALFLITDHSSLITLPAMMLAASPQVCPGRGGVLGFLLPRNPFDSARFHPFLSEFR
jgi:hypothetical protein